MTKYEMAEGVRAVGLCVFVVGDGRTFWGRKKLGDPCRHVDS